MRHIESAEQQALFEWVEFNKKKIDELELIYHIPNGGKRNIREAARLKQEGVKAGVPDIHLPIAKGMHMGLWIEMKAPGGKLTDNQKAWKRKLESWGHKVVVCYSWAEAKDNILEYLGVA